MADSGHGVHQGVARYSTYYGRGMVASRPRNIAGSSMKKVTWLLVRGTIRTSCEAIGQEPPAWVFMT